LKNIITIFGLLFCTSVLAQDSTSILTIKNTFWGIRVIQNNKKLTLHEARKIMEPNEEAYKVLRSAQTNDMFAGFLGVVGGVLIGWNLGEAISGKDPNWALSAVGGAAILGSIPLTTAAVNKTKQAAEIYNAGLKKTTYLRSPELRFCVAANKFGLKLNF
jgi:hypothetical protein